jgi:hypothetical protein
VEAVVARAGLEQERLSQLLAVKLMLLRWALAVLLVSAVQVLVQTAAILLLAPSHLMAAAVAED